MNYENAVENVVWIFFNSRLCNKRATTCMQLESLIEKIKELESYRSIFPTKRLLNTVDPCNKTYFEEAEIVAFEIAAFEVR